MKASLKTTLLAALFGMTSAAWSQPTPAQIQQQQFQQQQNMQGAIQSDNLRRCGDIYGHGCRRQENAAAQRRAWEARERKIQKEIAELRRTPFYYAVAYDFVNNRVLGGGGFYSEKRAIETALGGCKSSNCQIVATFANACGVVVEPDKGARTVEDFFVGIDPDDRKAAAKAIQACEAKHGNNQCSYWNVKTKTGMAFCSGYDYSIYGQH